MWDIYQRIRGLMDNGSRDIALQELSKYRAQARGDRFTALLVLEAECIAQEGSRKGHAHAVEILHEAAELDPDNFWIFYNLGHYLRNIGRDDEALAAIWRSHRIAGWPASERNGYRFTHDYFSGNIMQWRVWFETVIATGPIACLEIGSWQGASATWLLDNVISVRGGSLTCIDPFTGSSEHQTIVGGLHTPLQEIFESNIEKSGHAALCRKLVGLSQDMLRPLPPQSFDFIYVDGAHEAKFVIQDAILALPLLRPGGFMLFDDVPYQFPKNPRQNTARAVQFFIDVFSDELECLHSERQMLLQKVGSTGTRA